MFTKEEIVGELAARKKKLEYLKFELKLRSDRLASLEESIKFRKEGNKIIYVIGGIALLVMVIMYSTIMEVNGFGVFSISLMVCTLYYQIRDDMNHRNDSYFKRITLDIELKHTKIQIEELEKDVADLENEIELHYMDTNS